MCFIGPPLDPVFREKYGFDADKAWQAVLKYRERFDKTGIFECELYEGVADTIRKLKEQAASLHLLPPSWRQRADVFWNIFP